MQSLTQQKQFHAQSYLIIFAATVLVFGVQSPVLAGPSFTANVSLYQGVDLESGMTELDPTVLTLIFGDAGVEIVLEPDIENPFDFSDSVDFHFEYHNADSMLLALHDGIQAAIFADTDFDLITAAMLAEIEFQPNLSEFALDAGATVVLLTAEGSYMKLGNLARLPELGVSLTYERDMLANADVPEPSTLLLIGAGLLGIAACTRKRRRKSSGK